MGSGVSDLALAFMLADDSKIELNAQVVMLPAQKLGVLITLEQKGGIILRVVSNPAQVTKWWARRAHGVFTGTCESIVNGRSI